MSRSAWYGVLALLAAALVLLLLWLTLPAVQGTQAANPSAPPASMDHAGMDHGQAGPAPEDASLRRYLAEEETLMDDMAAAMDAVVPSGNAAADFLAGMLPHHAAAVAMAESYLSCGGAHEVLAPLARDILDAQTAEIAQMETLLEELQSSGSKDAAQSDAYWAAYHAGMDHSMSHTAAASLDAAFAQGMLMHHRMAVDMAGAILPNTDEEAVKTLAQAISDTQTQEIQRMEAVLKDLDAA